MKSNYIVFQLVTHKYAHDLFNDSVAMEPMPGKERIVRTIIEALCRRELELTDNAHDKGKRR